MSKVSQNFGCAICDVKCRDKYDLERHMLTAKHKKQALSDNFSGKKNTEFFCEKCNYTCSKPSLWKKHVKTKKHLGNFSGEKVSLPEENYECAFCAKCYRNYSSLWSHQKSCSQKSRDSNKKNTIKKSDEYVNIINTLMDENKDLKNIVIEQSKETKQILDKVVEMSNNKPQQQTINNTMNNNKFNINVFLHEECKNALNFSDFIDRISISHTDLENNAQLGFVDGISKIFLDNLKQLSVYERPIHCTDLKRETLYIRDEDTWNKDDNEEKLKNAIKEVSRKSMQTLVDWKEKNPEYNDMDSDFSNKCITIHKESNAGENRETYYPKVIKTLAKETSIVNNTK